MANVQESIDVSVPLSQAFNQWTQFEEFPRFMSGVESVRQLDETTVHFTTDIAGVRRDLQAPTSLSAASLGSSKNAFCMSMTGQQPFVVLAAWQHRQIEKANMPGSASAAGPVTSCR